MSETKSAAKELREKLFMPRKKQRLATAFARTIRSS